MKPAVTHAKAYLNARLQVVRKVMKQLKLDGMLLTTPADLGYLTNFTGDQSAGLLTADEVHLVTDFRFKEQAELECGWVTISLRNFDMAEALAKVITNSKLARVGFEGNFTTFGQVDALDRATKEAVKKVKGAKEVEFVPLQDVMVNIRKVKDDTEIDLIRKSIAIAEESFQAVRDEIKVGESENHLAGLLILEMRSRGATTTSFEPIVAAGAASSLPHYRPGDALVQRDQPLLFDWGAVYRGYCSDLTRTLMLGRVGQKMREIYKIVLHAQLAAIAFIRPGVTTMQADRVARDVIEKAGYKEQFGHGLGHGIGREIHERPVLRKTEGEEELRPGMIVTVEPGIYLPGEGGVRIEDDVLVTHSGCEVLSSIDKTFESCHIE